MYEIVIFIHLYYLCFFIFIQTYFNETEKHTDATLITKLADIDYICDVLYINL